MIIPALDEVGAIGPVVRGFAAQGVLREIVVADNGSKDGTGDAAKRAGAVVVEAPIRGYGRACLRAMDYLANESPAGPPDIVAFADGDGSNEPLELPKLIDPIARDEVDFVLGSRTRLASPGSLTIPQRAGSVLASRLLAALYGAAYTDLGPYRAIAWSALMRIGMIDQDYGWTVEMQIKAAKLGLRVREIDVHNHARIAGRSKVGGTVRGVVGASQKILRTIFKYR